MGPTWSDKDIRTWWNEEGARVCRGGGLSRKRGRKRQNGGQHSGKKRAEWRRWQSRETGKGESTREREREERTPRHAAPRDTWAAANSGQWNYFGVYRTVLIHSLFVAPPLRLSLALRPRNQAFVSKALRTLLLTLASESRSSSRCLFCFVILLQFPMRWIEEKRNQ